MIDALPAEKQEQIVFNKFFFDSEFRQVIGDNFQERFFDSLCLGKALEFVIGYFKKFEKVPSRELLETVLPKLAERNKKIDIRELQHSVSSALDLTLIDDKAFVKEVVLDFIKSKAAYFAIFDAVPLIEGTKSADASMEECIDSFSKIVNINFDESLGLDYFTKQAQDIHWEYLLNPEMKMSTGLTTLDAVMNGGIPKSGKCLITFMAPAGMGKSLFILNLGINLLSQNKFIVIITLELPEHMYAQRADSIITGENVNRLHAVADKARKKIDDFGKLHPNAKLLIKEYPPDTINCSTICAYLDKVISQTGRKPDAIIIDYINLLQPTRASKGANSYEKVGNVTREMRAMSYKYMAPVISVTQVNRSGYDTPENVGMQHVSESAGISHTTDLLAHLFQRDGDQDRGVINLGILKNRFGEIKNKSFEFAINYSSLKIYDMPEGERNEQEFVDPANLESMISSLN